MESILSALVTILLSLSSILTSIPSETATSQVRESVKSIDITVQEITASIAKPSLPLTPLATNTEPTASSPTLTSPIIITTPSMETHIIDPIPGKGRNRPLVASSQETDQSTIELGLQVLVDNVFKNDEVVTITTPDDTQNKTLTGTGTVMPHFLPNGTKEFVPYYPFYYHFKTSGEHLITFTITRGDVTNTNTITLSAN